MLLLVALGCGLLAASQVRQREAAVRRQVGPLVPVSVASRDLASNVRLTARDVRVRRVPAAYLPEGALGPGEIAESDRVAAPVKAGSYITSALLHGRAADRGRPALRPGERALDLSVTGGRELAGDAAPGSRVDVLVSTESREGAGRTFVALESAQLLALRPASGDETGPSGPDAEAGAGDGGAGSRATAVATVRVTLKQAVYLSAAENFAREVRLLARPPGDRRRAGRAGVSADGL